LEINFSNNQNITYDATGNERVEEKTNTSSSFSNDLDEAREASKQEEQTASKAQKEEELSVKEAQEKTSKLVDDIMSLFRTGLTVEEFKEMQRLLDEIKKKVDELEPPLSTKQLEEIDEMFKKLERMILEFQKKIKGEAIVEIEDSASNIKNKTTEESKDSDKNSVDIAGFLKRIEKAQEAIDDLKQNKIASAGKTTEELELLQKLKQAI